jgi:hypothetical protein
LRDNTESVLAVTLPGDRAFREHYNDASLRPVNEP